MRSKCDICRLCIYSVRRTIEFPLDWPCQQSLCQAVHLISFIFHVFSPALSKITISKASFPEANMHIRGCSCSLDFPSTYSLSTQTPPNNPVAALSFRELKVCQSFSNLSNSVFNQLFNCVYFIISLFLKHIWNG